MNPKRTYETTIIVNAGLEDHSIDSVIDNISEFIKNHGGDISTTERWGRKRLAYTIQKKNNGFYVYMMYDAPATVPPLLERYFHLEENIIRHLTVQMTSAAIQFRKDSSLAQPPLAIDEVKAVVAPVKEDDVLVIDEEEIEE